METPSKVSDTARSRTVSLYNYIEVAHFLGIDPYAILRDARIPVSALSNSETWIASSAVLSVYEATERASGCEHFGLLMSECRKLSHIGPLSLLLQHQPTARAIVLAIIHNQRHMNDTLLASLVEEDDVAFLRADFIPGYGIRSYSEAHVAIAYRAISEIMAGRWQPDRIHFRHAPPVDLSAHRRIFRCPVEFNSDFDGMTCTPAALDAENPAKDPELAAHANRFLQLLALERPQSTITDRSRHAICLLLHSSNANIERVADNLGMQSRQLQRQLESEGTSFYELLNETRRELALRYITTSSHPVSHISDLLGYASQSSFTRWFANEFGKSPLKWQQSYQYEESFTRSVF